MLNWKTFGITVGLILAASLGACSGNSASNQKTAPDANGGAMSGDAMSPSPSDARKKSGDAMSGDAMKKSSDAMSGDAMQSPAPATKP
ncbi:MAG TPA: hypothetical protein V6C65_29045 [Allocoleopsis sp.]